MSHAAFDVASIRAQFPVLAQSIDGKPLAYLDSTATTQKPLCVIDTMDTFYREHYSSVKRGVYRLSERTSQQFEATRRTLASFLNAASESEIVFTRGTTESINLVAWSWGRANLRPGDEILISALEHHANIVPWQIIAEHMGASIKVIPCDDQANLLLEEIPKLLSEKTKLVAVTHISNAVGTINPIAEIIRLVRKHSSALVLIDGAQSASHLAVDVQKLDCDFFVCSAHKMYGPTGIGMLYAKAHILDAMPPWHGGGEMIDRVTFAKTTFAPPPARFEAGTPPIAEVIGFGEALQWINRTGISNIHAHEEKILAYATAKLTGIPGLRIIGNPHQRASLLSFVIADPLNPTGTIHAHDAALILDEEGIAVRSGHHCAQPVMDRFGVAATVRASFAAYTEEWEIDRLVLALQRVLRVFG